MGEYGMKFEKSRKRKFDGGGDRRGSKKQKWNKNPGQSGSNAIPLGTRGNGTGVDSDERVPTSISRPHISNGLPAKDTEKWTEKKEKRKRESQKLLDAAVSATEKSSTPKEGKAKKKKKLGDDRNVATDGSRVDSKLHGGIVDKGEKESLDLTDDAKAVHSEQPKSGEETADRTANEKKERFICFVGQLPFTCTTEDIQKHFAKVQPNSIRHVSHKEGGQSKGYAFLEFDNWDRMRTCLKLYHHSEFEDGKSKPRKINIELTSGGGGNSESRRGKIESKNEKLEEERKRDYDEKKQEKRQKHGTDHGSGEQGREEKPKSTKSERRMQKSAEGHTLTKKQKKMKAKQEKKHRRNALSKKQALKKATAEQTPTGNDHAGMDPSRAAMMARQN